MKSLQKLVSRESAIKSIDSMTEKQALVFTALAKSTDVHKYGDVVSLGKVLEQYTTSKSKKTGVQSMIKDDLVSSNFITVTDVQKVIDYIAVVQTTALPVDTTLVPVIIGDVADDCHSLKSVCVKYEKKAAVQYKETKAKKAKKETKEEPITAKKIADDVISTCRDKAIDIKDVLDVLNFLFADKKEEDVSEKIA